MSARHELSVLIRAKYPILYLLTWEEQRALECVFSVAEDLGADTFVWSLTKGFRPPLPAKRSEPPQRLSPELEALAHLHGAPENAIFVLKDFHHWMSDYRVQRLLRDLAETMKVKNQTLILLSPVLRLPPELEKDVTVVDFGLPTEEEIAEVLDSLVHATRDREGLDLHLSPEQRELLLKTCLGLTLDEVESVFSRSLVQCKTLRPDVVLEEKKQIIRKSGLLEYYPATESFREVGGMEYLKEWLKRRSKSFTEAAEEFGLPPPKGVLLLGVQGCGKSLVAKTIASHWNLPMLRMDVGRIFGSLVGQSEANVRRAIQIAEGVAPCVLWADELEKGFAGLQGSGMSDSGTTARVFATFLTWMQEKTSPVFFVATANDVSKLPPELLRKGRFDEVFFIDLPDTEERREIFAIHLRKRKRDPGAFDLDALAALTAGFSGAEIEQTVVSALFAAFDAQRDLTQDDLVAEIKATIPLSVMMKEEIEALRDWAKLRARPASRNDDLD
ncbi:MAG: AAA family ATPase [Armatimonadetes bacterium]|nr:MAG: AAA family ATPase [Armatimonadota bacterium]